MALFSFAAALLTVISFCIGVAPIPLTGWVCFPLSIFFGSTALITGIKALRSIRKNNQNGRPLALFGIWAGTISILAVIAFTTLTALLMIYGLDNLIKSWK